MQATSVADPKRSAAAKVTLALPASDDYPRANAGTTARVTPPLPQIPVQGSPVAILDWSDKDPLGTEEDCWQRLAVPGIAAIPVSPVV